MFIDERNLKKKTPLIRIPEKLTYTAPTFTCGVKASMGNLMRKRQKKKREKKRQFQKSIVGNFIHNARL